MNKNNKKNHFKPEWSGFIDEIKKEGARERESESDFSEYHNLHCLYFTSPNYHWTTTTTTTMKKTSSFCHLPMNEKWMVCFELRNRRQYFFLVIRNDHASFESNEIRILSVAAENRRMMKICEIFFENFEIFKKLF